MKNILLAAFIFVYSFAFSQDAATEEYYVYPVSPYAAIDSLAKKVEYKDDIRLLSYELTKNYSTQLEKARAIFIWVTHNIAYDYKVLNKKKLKRDFFECKKKENCNIEYAKWEDNYLKKVIRNRKGICDGYARLFKKLCDHAGIQGSLVNGYTKSRPEEIGKMGRLNHSWNVMLIDGKYYYLDATWAAGGCARNKKGKYVKFYPHFEEYYWLTPIEKMSRDHFPADEEWIRDKPYETAKKTYRDNAYIGQTEIQRLDILSPDSGILNVCEGDTIKIRFRYHKRLFRHLQVNTNIKSNPNPWKWSDDHQSLDPDILEEQQYIPFKFDLKSDSYSFTYVVDSKKLKHIDVLIDYRHALRFKINVMKP
ncbi:transglutaminase domain-containing protein [Flavobacterium sp. DG1-102-2]|uniref:transglutaminase domain-containing protein n=1 Tax=Flavobacterium sp. DG1-102-2 TaxID=3081663 RepID=UPI002949E01B|nr:transglutaminase domain-containing protein [Flavobacterium sp. DG1-102-2]MDV6168578.1 transglutaminase domain-containing protein [Flavobacterium sp. DG1-102-2]